MTTIQKPFEMPFLHTTPDDFGLSRSEVNQRQAERLLAAPYRVFHEDGTVLLGCALHRSLGELFLYKKDEPALTYYLRFDVKMIEPVGIAAAKVALWRRCAPGLEGGTSDIIYSLLDEYDAVVSESSITPTGQRFWIDRMAEAYGRGLIVGVTNGDILVPYDNRRHLLDWVQSLDGWGNKDEAGCTCFFVSKKAVTRGDLQRSC